MAEPCGKDALSVSGPERDVTGRPLPPVVVGGLGGSGTRLIAEILAAHGYFLGADLNEASDNLWFTLLFKRSGGLDLSAVEFTRRLTIFLRAMAGGAKFSAEDRDLIAGLAAAGWEQHAADWLRARADSLLSREETLPTAGRWGWKEPNTHIYLDRLGMACEGMKYVFVSRHGLDMALSGNQNQARLWGPEVLGHAFEPTPRYALRYWCAAHRHALAAGRALGERFFFLRYDDLCRDPRGEVARLLAFVGVEDAEGVVRSLDRIAPSSTLGRSKNIPRSAFDAVDVAYVESLGYVVDNA